MALAIRHWALACGIIVEKEREFERPSSAEACSAASVLGPVHGTAGHRLARAMAGRRRSENDHHVVLGLQPFGGANLRSRGTLSTSILQYARARQWSRIAEKTVTRDVECFIRSYVPRSTEAPVKMRWSPCWPSSGSSGRLRAASTNSGEAPSRASPMASSPTR